jgi:hypothetical protein
MSNNVDNHRWRRPAIVKIYLMQIGETDIYKIGYTSRDIKLRLNHLKFYISDIKLIDFVETDFSIEKHFHDVFKWKNIKIGSFNEFFKLDTKDLDYVYKIFNYIKNENSK